MSTELYEDNLSESARNARDRADQMYRSRHSRGIQETVRFQAGSVITEQTDFSPDRDVIRRVRYVCDQILGMFPSKDMKYTALKTMMYESLKDLARIPDDQIMMMSNDMGRALDFIANGSMAELEAALREQSENAGD